MFRNTLSKVANIFAGLVIVSQISACGPKEEKAASGNADFDALWTNVFVDSCGTCHGVSSNTGTLGGVDLRTKATFHSNFVSKKPSDYPDWTTFKSTKVACANIFFVSPSNAAKSLLVAVFDSTVAAALSPCQVKSHLTPDQSITISGAQVTSLKSWIDSGAAL